MIRHEKERGKTGCILNFSALVHVSEALCGIGQAVGCLECAHVFKLLLLECEVSLCTFFWNFVFA